VLTGDQDDVGWQQQIGRCSSDTPESCHDGSSALSSISETGLASGLVASEVGEGLE